MSEPSCEECDIQGQPMIGKVCKRCYDDEMWSGYPEYEDRRVEMSGQQ